MIKRGRCISLCLALFICVAAAGCDPASRQAAQTSAPSSQTDQAGLPSPAPSQNQAEEHFAVQEESVTDVQTPPPAESESLSPPPDQEEEPFWPPGGCVVEAFVEPSDNLNFTAQLLARQYQLGQNLLLSPIGLRQALTLAANGAAGQTLEEYLALFHASDRYDLIDDTCWQREKMLDTPDYFKTANSVWLDVKHADHANPRYAEDCREYFQADVMVERLDDSAVPLINEWVSGHTDHMIPSLVSELPKDCQGLMINTLLFDAKWKKSFDPEYTVPRIFHGSTGDKTLPFMHRSYTLMPWYEADGLQATSIDYDDGRTAMLVVLPQDMDSFMAGLQSETLRDIMAAFRNSQQQYVCLSMPRFTIEYDSKGALSDALRDMGLQEALSGHGDYSGICKDFAVQDVLQKTVLEVGELGTKAAAATGVIAAGGAMPPEVIHDLTLDRPFFCAVYNKETNLVYFAGAVCQPESLT